jgi:non-specific serine/threonine protein kinase
VAIRHAELVKLALERVAAGDSSADGSVDSENIPHNLPAELSSFVGREREERDFSAVLSTARLFTVTGPGGVGKTRLAQRLARAALPECPDGVWFVDLSQVTEPELVVRTVSGVLGIAESRGEAAAASLATSIKHRRLLLVLDNCEHLIDACAELAFAFLNSSAGVRTLATSREPLGVVGETVRQLGPLAVPDSQQTSRVERLLEFGSMQLLLQRAAGHGSQIDLDEAGPALSAICNRLDGLPLALELAAARLPALGPAELVIRLDDALGVLVGGQHHPLDRHATLWGTFEWSHTLLTPAERHVFNALSVFVGGWTLEACEWVAACAGVEERDVLDLLSRLVARSLVVVEPRPGGTVRYRLLETVRQFAARKIQQSGQMDALRTRHREWFLDQADQAMRAAHGTTESREFKRLETDLPNLRAALDWVMTGPKPIEHSAVVVARLWWFWQTVGTYSEGRAQLERLLKVGRAALSPRTQAAVLFGAGMLAWNQQADADLEAAQRYHEEALSIRNALGDAAGIRSSLGGLARTLRDRGDIDGASRIMDDLLQKCLVAGDQWRAARTYNGLALIAFRRGDVRFAMEYFERSLSLSRELGDHAGVATELANMALAAYVQGELTRAWSLATQSLTLRRDLGVRWSMYYTLIVIAGLAASAGQHERASRLLGASDRLRADAGQTPDRQIALSQDVYERTAASARAQMGALQFSVARASGRGMPPHQAVAEALADLPLQKLSGDGVSRSVLTRREEQVVSLLRRGLSNRQIAEELIISEATAAKHVEHIRDKLGVRSRTQIVTLAGGEH